MINIAVCDDEPYMLESIVRHLSDYMASQRFSYQIFQFPNGETLLQTDQAFDLLFLDIQMIELNGLQTAKCLRERGFEGLIIFVTVLRECVFDSFGVEAYDYLLKPIDDGRFRHTMDRALALLEKRVEKTLLVQRGSTCRMISYSEIVYCEVLGRKIYLHIQGGETVDYYSKLADLEKTVDSRFFRCHRSYLVNLDWVRGFKMGNVILADGSFVPVSRLREQDFKQALLSHMKARGH